MLCKLFSKNRYDDRFSVFHCGFMCANARSGNVGTEDLVDPRLALLHTAAHKLVYEMGKRAVMSSARASYNGDLIQRIFGFIETEYARECSLKRLAEELAYDHSYLSRYFKSNVGIGFNEYVMQYRINIACEQLANTDTSVLQCAMDCGYTSLRSFNRAFKAVLSITPSEYKRLSKN